MCNFFRRPEPLPVVAPRDSAGIDNTPSALARRPLLSAIAAVAKRSAHDALMPRPFSRPAHLPSSAVLPAVDQCHKALHLRVDGVEVWVAQVDVVQQGASFLDEVLPWLRQHLHSFLEVIQLQRLLHLAFVHSRPAGPALGDLLHDDKIIGPLDASRQKLVDAPVALAPLLAFILETVTQPLSELSDGLALKICW